MSYYEQIKWILDNLDSRDINEAVESDDEFGEEEKDIKIDYLKLANKLPAGTSFFESKRRDQLFKDCDGNNDG